MYVYDYIIFLVFSISYISSQIYETYFIYTRVQLIKHELFPPVCSALRCMR